MEERAYILITKNNNGSRTLFWRGSKNGIVTVDLELAQNISDGSDLSLAIEKYGLEEVRRDSQSVFYRRTK